MTERRRYPSPFRPLPAVARATLPGQETAPRPQPRPRERLPIATPLPATDAVAEVQRFTSVNPVLTITAEITLPQKEGYARRLNNLLRALRASLEEEAPWLTNVDITVSASSRR